MLHIATNRIWNLFYWNFRLLSLFWRQLLNNEIRRRIQEEQQKQQQQQQQLQQQQQQEQHDGSNHKLDAEHQQIQEQIEHAHQHEWETVIGVFLFFHVRIRFQYECVPCIRVLDLYPLYTSFILYNYIFFLENHFTTRNSQNQRLLGTSCSSIHYKQWKKEIDTPFVIVVLCRKFSYWTHASNKQCKNTFKSVWFYYTECNCHRKTGTNAKQLKLEFISCYLYYRIIIQQLIF